MTHANGSSQTAVDQIAHYAANLRFEDLSDLSVKRSRQIVLDTIGTAIGGYQTRLGKLATDYAATMQQGQEASLIGDGRCSTLEGAAWANGVMAKHLGMDDSGRVHGHVAAEVVPAVLAIGEQKQLSGRQIITAMAIGYEVMGVIQPAVKDWQRVRGLDHKGQAATMATAVAAAVAFGLSEEQIGNALALAMDMACGTEQYVYDAGKNDTKDLLAGYGARNGIYAAKLAAFGFQGPPGALDGEYGYFHAFGPGYDSAFLDKLGHIDALANTSFKPHAGCRHVHACVDATQQLMAGEKPPLAEIVSIEIDTYKNAITPSFRVNYEPDGVGAAGFSLPVTASIILTSGNWYKEDIAKFDDPEARRLRHLVKVGLDEAIMADYPNKNGCEVRITTRDGQLYKGRVEHAKGEPENMLSDAEFASKFRYLVDDLLSEERIADIMATAGDLESLDDVGDLVRLTYPDNQF
ncbi:MAG: MmgE/PrpD family protein [Chloroflexota bacterium]